MELSREEQPPVVVNTASATYFYHQLSISRPDCWELLHDLSVALCERESLTKELIAAAGGQLPLARLVCRLLLDPAATEYRRSQIVRVINNMVHYQPEFACLLSDTCMHGPQVAKALVEMLSSTHKPSKVNAASAIASISFDCGAFAVMLHTSHGPGLRSGLAGLIIGPTEDDAGKSSAARAIARVSLHCAAFAVALNTDYGEELRTHLAKLLHQDNVAFKVCAASAFGSVSHQCIAFALALEFEQGVVVRSGIVPLLDSEKPAHRFGAVLSLGGISQNCPGFAIGLHNEYGDKLRKETLKIILQSDSDVNKNAAIRAIGAISFNCRDFAKKFEEEAGDENMRKVRAYILTLIEGIPYYKKNGAVAIAGLSRQLPWTFGKALIEERPSLKDFLLSFSNHRYELLAYWSRVAASTLEWVSSEQREEGKKRDLDGEITSDGSKVKRVREGS